MNVARHLVARFEQLLIQHVASPQARDEIKLAASHIAEIAASNEELSQLREAAAFRPDCRPISPLAGAIVVVCAALAGYIGTRLALHDFFVKPGRQSVVMGQFEAPLNRGATQEHPLLLQNLDSWQPGIELDGVCSLLPEDHQNFQHLVWQPVNVQIPAPLICFEALPTLPPRGDRAGDAGAHTDHSGDQLPTDPAYVEIHASPKVKLGTSVSQVAA